MGLTNIPKDGHMGCHGPKDPCPQLPGTLIRIFIPQGAVINLLNLVEIASPSGVCLIVRIPLLGTNTTGIGGIFDAIRQAGGTVEVVKG